MSSAPGDPDPTSSPSRGSSDPLLRLRITHITSTMSSPLPALRDLYVPTRFATSIPPGNLPHQLPVLRIFGTTPSLQKICANIHLCYPYFYVPFPMESTDPLRPERVVKLCQRFAVSLNHAICLAMRQNPTSTMNATRYGGGVDPRHLHVMSVMLVKGVPFYGYHLGYQYFLKVSLVNPQRMYVALEQLRKPAVLGREWQPHEAHMNHVLQFMCDYDLYGCGWLDLGGGKFREPLPEGDPYDSPPSSPEQRPAVFDSITVPESMLYPIALSPPKDTFTPLEIDVLPHQILNRQRLKPRNLHHDFIELLHRPLDPYEKLVPAVAELWEDERRRRTLRGMSLGSDAMMPGSGGMGGRTMEELGYKVEGKEKKENRGGNWKISEELWGILGERMEEERQKRGKLTFEKFTTDAAVGQGGEKRKYDRWVMTSFEAVTAHWPRLPRPPRSTQKSKRSRHSPPLSSPTVAALSSSQAAVGPSSPVVPLRQVETKRDDDAHSAVSAHGGTIGNIPEEDGSDSDDDLNPFEAFAITQASQHLPIDVEVNSRMVQRDFSEGPSLHDRYDDEEDYDADAQRHAEEAKHHAEQGEKIRATQKPQKDDSSDIYDDEELDELFRQTVAAGLGVGSAPNTPRRYRGHSNSVTPSTLGSTSGGTLDNRRQKRNQRMIEQAGLGDLSIIMDRSSVSLSEFGNPYGDQPTTPTKPKTPVSEKPTPSTLMRNLFAKNRGQSPLNSPSKHNGIDYESPNAIVLPPLRRTVGDISSSPTPSFDDDDLAEMQEKVTRQLGVTQEDLEEAKQELKEMEAKMPDEEAAELFFRPAQKTPSTKESKSLGDPDDKYVTPLARTKRTLSPTFRDDEVTPSATMLNSAIRGTGGVESTARIRKRVRLATPPGSTSQSRLLPSQHTPISSAGTVISQHSAPTVGSDSTTPLLASDAWQYHQTPPSASEIVETMEAHGVPSATYQPPYYSNPIDVPPRAKMFAGRMFTLKGDGAKDLEDFESSVGSGPNAGKRWLKPNKRHIFKWTNGWEYAPLPPARNKVVQWCDKEDEAARVEAQKHALATSQLARPTQKSKYGFKFSQKGRSKESEREHQNMSVLALEVFAVSRHQLLPDPEKDAVTAVFYCYQNEDESLPDTTVYPGYHAGYVVLDNPQANPARLKLDGVPYHVVDNELDLINWVIDTVKGWDPDVLAGWELHNSSWGYLAARANEEYSIDLMDQLSRVLTARTGPKNDGYSAHHTSTFKVAGRHILNIWRICRSEVNLNQYTFENVVFHILHQRVPHYSPANLTALWKSKVPGHAHRVLKYFFQRVVIDIEIVDQAEIITKNAEFARVFGVDFASVMFRGSQFKVESFMFRIAKPESFVLVSPSKQQVGLQNAPFAVPLIAEPESKYYNHPIIVLDFQSLYPSVMIAYNICYSTCLGRVEKFKGTHKFGFTELKVADGLLELLKDYLTVTPNGMVFVKPAVRKSLLAKMLGEILDTRVMVKHAMKSARGDKSLTALLNARQLGLKLMANVTYGYTSATYSGRMPCIEVADSIVQTGRETLEKAQELIHSRPDWAAQVVYGDTDSLFVALPGRTKEQAFKIGNDIADSVTALNPKPVKLKFEKVYMGSVLMAKKRYVGFKYEHPDDKEPVFDAKGIETIRRDGFPAQQKIEEVCLKLLFRTQDLSQVKDFCRQEWTKILQGRVSIQDFIVAKEVRLGTYSEKGVPPPGAAVAYRRILKDPRDEPQYAERVPYLVSNADGRRLIDRARMPEEMLTNRSLGIDAEYYIRNLLIPPISRIFNLVGADVEGWFESMPRVKRVGKYERDSTVGAAARSRGGRGGGKKAGRGRSGMRIDSHFRSSHCIVCGVETTSTLCSACRSDPSTTSHALLSRQHLAQNKLLSFQKICASCSSTPVGERILCDSIDCPITYARVGAERDVEDLVDVAGLIEELKVDDEDEVEEVGVGVGGVSW
ncbi:hypothetical protein IAR55_000259 [Kwoniella newhampshirensis]|uniref:DNA polymerase n=1 Tax=Kwoniella newhampshirensis TaxID=1651941 RepID=A0AAW0Z660_9TREE